MGAIWSVRLWGASRSRFLLPARSVSPDWDVACAGALGSLPSSVVLASRRFLCAALACCASLWALPARAAASQTQASIVQDDTHLVYESQAQALRTMHVFALLGVQWVKIQVIWGIVAPSPHSKHRPKFDASDPAAYHTGGWTRYDFLVRLAQSLGMKVYFQLAPPSPRWAFDRRFPASLGRRLGHAPDPTELERFVEAVGRRYSGAYPSRSTALPRVGIWGIWNEPNYPAWLQPTRRKLASGILQQTQPWIYRGMINAAWRGLQNSGHRGDTILIGETANAGNETPLPFVKDLYCVNASYRQLTGNAAAREGCPYTPNRAQFVSRNPGLFAASGWAHHPYGFDTAPNRPVHESGWITLYNIRALERTLNATLASYRIHPPGGTPVYVTEWGYRTNPPNPYVRTSLSQQQTWLDQGDYQLWRAPYVKSIANFLLFDGPPVFKYPRGSRKYYSNFQTGLEYYNGKPKPSFSSYPVPVWLPNPRHGSHVTVWSQLRAANHSAVQTGLIQFRRSKQARWTTIRAAQTSSRQGFLITAVAIPSAGWLRVGCRNKWTGQMNYSRTVAIP